MCARYFPWTSKVPQLYILTHKQWTSWYNCVLVVKTLEYTLKEVASLKNINKMLTLIQLWSKNVVIAYTHLLCLYTHMYLDNQVDYYFIPQTQMEQCSTSLPHSMLLMLFFEVIVYSKEADVAVGMTSLPVKQSIFLWKEATLLCVDVQGQHMNNDTTQSICQYITRITLWNLRVKVFLVDFLVSHLTWGCKSSELICCSLCDCNYY